MSITPICLDAAPESAASNRLSASAGASPFASASSSSLPYSVRVFACVATAPTPLRTHGTPPPTQGTRVVTATPTSPVRGSIAAIEKVWKTSESRHSNGT